MRAVETADHGNVRRHAGYDSRRHASRERSSMTRHDPQADAAAGRPDPPHSAGPDQAQAASHPQPAAVQVDFESSAPTASLESAVSAPPVETVPRAVDGALYPGFYTWYVFMAALDVLMTRIILSDFFGGYEVNWLAHWIMTHGSMHAATLFKFGTVIGVILICEFVGRRDYSRGRRLARWAVIITAMPVLISFTQLLVDLHAWLSEGDLRMQTAPGGPYK